MEKKVVYVVLCRLITEGRFKTMVVFESEESAKESVKQFRQLHGYDADCSIMLMPVYSGPEDLMEEISSINTKFLTDKSSISL
jgi:hypothetical protein